MTTSIIVDLKSCRVCLLRNGSISVFEKRNEMILANMITECTNLQIKQDDDFPKNICDSCVEEVVTAYSFKVECHNSNSIIQIVFSKEIICENEFEAEYLDDVQEHNEILTINESEKNKKPTLSELKIEIVNSISYEDIKILDVFTCNICLKEFDQEALLIEHTNDHLTETNFKCKISDKSFDPNCSLKEYVNTKEALENMVSYVDCSVESNKNYISVEDDPTKSVKFKENNEIILDKPKKESSKLLAPISQENDALKILSCSVCCKIFEQKEKLNIHNKEDHMIDWKFQCKLCDKKYRTKSLRERHMKAHTSFNVNDKNKFRKFDVTCEISTFKNVENTQNINKRAILKFNCDNCDQIFEFKYELKKHSELHNKTFECNICNKIFKSDEVLKNHRMVHSIEFQCEICQMKFSNLRNFKNHLQKHTKKQFICEICSKEFYHRRELVTHQSIIHRKEKPFKCDICDKKFSLKSILNCHLRCHTGEKPYKCRFCDKMFRENSTMRAHIKLKHTGDTKYQCDICSEKFVVPSALLIHKRIHTGEKPYQCQHCNKEFARFSAFKMHKLIHTGEKPFECEICKKKFRIRNSLTKHLVLHSGVKPYECNFCNAKYANADNAKTHTKYYCKKNPDRIKKVKLK